jgi:hypothetical protein
VKGAAKIEMSIFPNLPILYRITLHSLHNNKWLPLSTKWEPPQERNRLRRLNFSRATNSWPFLLRFAPPKLRQQANNFSTFSITKCSNSNNQQGLPQPLFGQQVRHHIKNQLIK